MARRPFDRLHAFVAVATERSFTRAAARLGLAQSSLSQTVRELEEELGIRLLTRSTRSVAPTEAGERLLRSIGPQFAEMEAALDALSELRDKPAGTIRITAGEHPAVSVLQPALARFLPSYPDIHVELIIDQGLTNIVADQFDAGVRLGEQVARDMIAVRIGPDMRMAVVVSPGYLSGRDPPLVPQDLTQHRCINMRMPTHDSLFAWEFEKDGREVKVRVEGQLTYNSLALRLSAALDGLGLAYLPEPYAEAHVASGRLIQVLQDWCPLFAGYHLYYSSRRQASPAFRLLVEALRQQAGSKR
ncbi:LysR family transcriptional regulator [Rubellimicrobium aerolatum]|uniref:LysR substrate-binding domain-containing protein n=1 Tax=Rubellimicrobium aerolatum TaxID=490979 RepID=A0ABW0S814_9RHOB|nr:LysR family transcriptional regulator [Rubellimicrobium aerolatum]MBP1804388.1 DNA-binding transcriptional LysR family regulator [Rubellimicrobium aerolatum]